VLASLRRKTGLCNATLTALQPRAKLLILWVGLLNTVGSANRCQGCFAARWSFYTLASLDTGKSAENTTLSTLTTFGFVSGHDFSCAVKAQTELGFSPCAFFWSSTCNCGVLLGPSELALGASFALAGAKALIILG